MATGWVGAANRRLGERRLLKTLRLEAQAAFGADYSEKKAIPSIEVAFD